MFNPIGWQLAQIQWFTIIFPMKKVPFGTCSHTPTLWKYMKIPTPPFLLINIMNISKQHLPMSVNIWSIPMLTSHHIPSTSPGHPVAPGPGTAPRVDEQRCAAHSAERGMRRGGGVAEGPGAGERGAGEGERRCGWKRSLRKSFRLITWGWSLYSPPVRWGLLDFMSAFPPPPSPPPPLPDLHCKLRIAFSLPDLNCKH